MVLFDDIHRNVVAVLDRQEGLSNIEYWHTDVTKAINRAVAEIREAYTKAGIGQYFVHTQRIYTTIEDLNYPYLRYVMLEKTPLAVTPAHLAFYTSNFFRSEDELLDRNQTFAEGSIVFKDDGFAYEALTNISNANTFDLTFIPGRTRLWYPNNNLKYRVGDIVKQASDAYYRCLVDHTNTINPIPLNPEEVEFDSNPAWERLYWRQCGKAFVTGVYYDFHRLNQLKTIDNPDQFYGFSVVRDRLYVTRNINNFTISYVPEWEPVSNLDDEIQIPYEMLREVEQLSLKLLEPIVGMPLADNRVNEVRE